MEKECSECGKSKTLDQFYKDASRKDGLNRLCRPCSAAAAKKYRAENPEKDKASKKKWQTDNPGKWRAITRKWATDNPEKKRAIERKCKAKSRDKINAACRNRNANDPAFKLAKLLRDRLRYALKNKSKRGSAVKLLGCTIEELLIRFEGLFTDGMTWTNHGAWHIDHIRPLCSFDLEDPEQLAIACHYSNLQPLWAFDNQSKGGLRHWGMG